MNPEYIASLISLVGAGVLAVISLLLKRLLRRIDDIEDRVTSLDALTSTRIHDLDMAAQARIATLMQAAEAKAYEMQTAQSIRDDAMLRSVREHALEADRKYATVREIVNVQDRLLAIDNNVRAVLTAIDRLFLK